MNRKMSELYWRRADRLVQLEVSWTALRYREPRAAALQRLIEREDRQAGL